MVEEHDTACRFPAARKFLSSLPDELESELWLIPDKLEPWFSSVIEVEDPVVEVDGVEVLEVVEALVVVVAAVLVVLPPAFVLSRAVILVLFPLLPFPWLPLVFVVVVAVEVVGVVLEVVVEEVVVEEVVVDEVSPVVVVEPLFSVLVDVTELF